MSNKPFSETIEELIEHQQAKFQVIEPAPSSETIERDDLLSKRVIWLNLIWSITGWSLSELTQPNSLISELKKFKPYPTYHRLVD